MTYHFRLQRTDGSPADPPTYRSSVLTWRQGVPGPKKPHLILRQLLQPHPLSPPYCYLKEEVRT